jgi:hypothetical protein
MIVTPLDRRKLRLRHLSRDCTGMSQPEVLRTCHRESSASSKRAPGGVTVRAACHPLTAESTHCTSALAALATNRPAMTVLLSMASKSVAHGIAGRTIRGDDQHEPSSRGIAARGVSPRTRSEPRTRAPVHAQCVGVTPQRLCMHSQCVAASVHAFTVRVCAFTVALSEKRTSPTISVRNTSGFPHLGWRHIRSRKRPRSLR